MNYIHLPILILIFILFFWLLIFSEFCLGPERINKIQRKICTFMAYRLLNFLPVNDEEIENLELPKKSTYVFYGCVSKPRVLRLDCWRRNYDQQQTRNNKTKQLNCT